MRFLLLLFVSTFFSQILTSQKSSINRKLATLENFNWVMGLEEVTRPQLDSAYKIIEDYRHTNIDTFDILNKYTLDNCENLNNTSTYATLLTFRGWRNMILGKTKEAEQYYNQAKKIWIDTNNQPEIAQINLNLGGLKANNRKYNEAVEKFLNSLQVFENLADTVNMIRANLYLGQNFLRMGHLDKGKLYQRNGLHLARAMNRKDFIMYSLGELGITFRQHMIDLEEQVIKDSLKGTLLRDSISVVGNYARKYNQESYDLATEIGDVFQQGRVINLLIDTERILGNYKKAISYGQKGIKLNERIGDKENDMLTNLMLGKTYFGMQNFKQAQLHAESAKTLVNELGENGNFNLDAVQHLLYKIYKRKGDFKKSLSAFENFHDISINNIDKENTAAVFELETQYQTAQKEKEILQQRNDILELETTNAAVVKQRNYILGGSLLLTLMTFFGYQLNKTRRERNDKIAFAEALMYAQEDERKRIAHDLHDGIGQSLLLIKKQIEGSQAVSKENQRMIIQTLEEVRSMSRDLDPFQIEKFGLTDTIQEMIQKVENSTDLFITQEIANIDQVFLEKQLIHIYRAIQEGLNNVVKHSGATAVRVTIEKYAKIVLITILDNGKGFDYELAVARSKSLGLRTMHERITNIGGTIKFSGNTPKGTKVEIQLPI